MNRKIINLLFGVASLMAVNSANAIPFTIDELIGSANLGNSSDALEIQTLAGILNVQENTLTFDSKDNSPEAVVQTDLSWYIDVYPSTPGYFILKFGIGGTTVSDDTYFFKNISELTKLVWKNEQVNYLTGGDCGARNSNACNIGRLSHVTLATSGSGGDDENPIPEPASLGLLGLGLLAMGVVRRRKVVLKG